ncbi:type II toxin-antitoxin system HicB family antitoxin [Massilia sp. B-10]|nr:type II toxin-antitoxin system HicB family antitoxin [Massilia sp. B-10]UUZ54911.1 type II toxin-antitoxin system HicB family antitoxin [Massilia sp. H-1]
MQYPVQLHPDTNGTFLVSFPDFPEANAVGDNETDAMREATDALLSALTLYFDIRKPVPMPSARRRGEPAVVIPALESAKILLWNEMFKKKIRKADLARMLNVQAPQIDRLFDLRHASKIEFVEMAAQALGKKLVVSLV